MKSLFSSRFGEDGCIIQSDFTALEVYVQATLTNCKNLIEDLKSGVDMHCMRLSVKEKLPYDEVLLKCKGDEAKGVAPIKEWGYKRTSAKEFSFQRALNNLALIKPCELSGTPDRAILSQDYKCTKCGTQQDATAFSGWPRNKWCRQVVRCNDYPEREYSQAAGSAWAPVGRVI